MEVRMEVTFDRNEVYEIAKAEYIRLFGPPAKGYKLFATERYCNVTVTTMRDTSVEPEPVGAIPEGPVVVEVPMAEAPTDATLIHDPPFAG